MTDDTLTEIETTYAAMLPTAGLLALFEIPALIAEVRRLREEHDALHNDISALIAHVEDHGEDAASDEVYVALLKMRKPAMSSETP